MSDARAGQVAGVEVEAFLQAADRIRKAYRQPDARGARALARDCTTRRAGVLLSRLVSALVQARRSEQSSLRSPSAQVRGRARKIRAEATLRGPPFWA